MEDMTREKALALESELMRAARKLQKERGIGRGEAYIEAAKLLGWPDGRMHQMFSVIQKGNRRRQQPVSANGKEQAETPWAQLTNIINLRFAVTCILARIITDPRKLESSVSEVMDAVMSSDIVGALYLCVYDKITAKG